MDLKELDNSQMILLTLFVSFVTSIAAGIVTISLMEEAPQVVTQTVRQVVTKTVEKVVPGDVETKVITKEKTVIVKEADLIAAAVQKNMQNLVSIYKMTEKIVTEEEGGVTDDLTHTETVQDETETQSQTATPVNAEVLTQETTDEATTTEETVVETVPVFIARGVILSSDGYIATDGNAINEGIVYMVALPGVQETVPLRLIGIENGVAIVKIDATGLSQAKPATSTVKLGQSVVALMGGVSIRVANSIVSNVLNDGDIIGTNINGYVTPGSPLIDLEGDVIGLSTTKSKVHGESAFVFVDSVLSALAKTKAQQE